MLTSAITNTVISFITVNFKEPMELSVVILTEHFDISGFNCSEMKSSLLWVVMQSMLVVA
jgi:hypothetical protein